MSRIVDIDNRIREQQIPEEQRNFSLALFSAVTKDRKNTIEFFSKLNNNSKEEIKPIIKRHIPDFEES